ncbi:secreted RxLR effector protein 161-like [Cornus florida]|uniref:secreted RxLR effector protein 161-like n=1 Tax=Cornus florida TaxID=4283 RepID=UPI0028A194AD|nr:secreted RxLR effector protein 161-like [Cornus florida]
MDKAHPLSYPMVVRSLDVKKYHFHPQEVDEELLGPEVTYLSVIGALMYLANCTWPNIVFSVNLLARYSSAPPRRHWNGIKHILRYLRGTIDMGLFYSKEPNSQLIGYADAGYLSDPHKAHSQTGYVFTCGGTAISRRFMKQTMIATSSNYFEILVIHETIPDKKLSFRDLSSRILSLNKWQSLGALQRFPPDSNHQLLLQ